MEQKQWDRRRKMILDLFADPKYKPMKLKELAILLDLSREDRLALKEVLDSLLAEGKISLSSRGKYAGADTYALTGIFQGTRRGFGFVTPQDGGEEIFIPEESTAGAFHLDTVQYLKLGEANGDKKAWGRIVKVVSRGMTEVVGTYERYKSHGFVIPDNQKLAYDVFIPAGKSLNAVDGHKVVVKLKSYGDKGHNPEGVVTQILGHRNDPGVDIQSVLLAYGIPMEFPESVMEQVSQIPDHVTEQELTGRLDLRQLTCVTIDGEDAKDLDDAITLTKEQGVYHLGVHIADVSHYVTEGSPLDQEALNRSTSVYLVDRVVPMLPHALSNGICSLQAGEDRLTLSCLMDIDETGHLLSYRVAEAVIHVTRRMSYTEVYGILETLKGADSQGRLQTTCRELAHDESDALLLEQLTPFFLQMEELATILRQKRYDRGAIDFDFPESKIVLDAKGRPVSVEPYIRNEAHRIIEDFMLMANETIAEDFYWQETPFLYRSHEKPDSEKMLRLTTFLRNFGLYLKGRNDEIRPKELQKLLNQVSGTPEETLISQMTLRSLKQAKYTTECLGHFGLAANYYCHFTSPIRRYPDLQIHRIIKEQIKGQMDTERMTHYEEILPEVAVQTSRKERRADDVEREVDKIKKVQYMKKFLGCDFYGVVSGVTSWGMYVELPNTVEGCVRMADLVDDYYVYDEAHMELRGEKRGNCYRLGQVIHVQVARVDTMAHTIDFVPCMNE